MLSTMSYGEVIVRLKAAGRPLTLNFMRTPQGQAVNSSASKAAAGRDRPPPVEVVSAKSATAPVDGVRHATFRDSAPVGIIWSQRLGDVCVIKSVRDGSPAATAGLVPLLSLEGIGDERIGHWSYDEIIAKIKATRPLTLRFTKDLISDDSPSPCRSAAQVTLGSAKSFSSEGSPKVRASPRSFQQTGFLPTGAGGYSSKGSWKKKSRTSKASQNVLFVLPGPLGLSFAAAADGPVVVLQKVQPGSAAGNNDTIKVGMQLVSYRVGNNKTQDLRHVAELNDVMKMMKGAGRPLLLTFEETLASRSPSPQQKALSGEAVLALQHTEEASVASTAAPDAGVWRVPPRAVRQLQQLEEGALLVEIELADEAEVKRTRPPGGGSSMGGGPMKVGAREAVRALMRAEEAETAPLDAAVLAAMAAEEAEWDLDAPVAGATKVDRRIRRKVDTKVTAEQRASDTTVAEWLRRNNSGHLTPKFVAEDIVRLHSLDRSPQSPRPQSTSGSFWMLMPFRIHWRI